MKKKLQITLFTAIVCLIRFASAENLNLIVTDFTSDAIQTAYNSAAAQAGNHIISLRYGEYKFTAPIKCDTGEASSIKITSLANYPAKHPVLMAEANNAFEIKANNVTIEGMEIITKAIGIRIIGNRAKITRCYIHPLPSQKMQIGININKADNQQADSVEITNNLITGNEASGIQVFVLSGKEKNKSLRIINNTIIMGNGTAAGKKGYGINLFGEISSDAIIANNAICYANTGIKATNSVTCSFIRNLIYNASSYVAPLDLFLPPFSTDSIITDDPRFAAYNSVNNTSGRPWLQSSPVVNAANSVLAPARDLYNQLRTVPDIGAIEYTAAFCDTIYVDDNGSDNSNGRYSSTPIKKINFAFTNKIPEVLFFPVVIKVMPGIYSETIGAGSNIDLKGKTCLNNSWIRIEAAEEMERPVIFSSTLCSCSVRIQSDNISLDGFIIKSYKGKGILVDAGSNNVKISRCFILSKPINITGPDPAIEIKANANNPLTQNVTVENCLIDYKGANGAISLNAEGIASRIDSVKIINNTLFMEDGKGAAGIKISSGADNMISNLNILYNIFDSPKTTAVLAERPVSSSTFSTNCVFNSPTIVNGQGASSLVLNKIIELPPKFVNEDAVSNDFLKLDSLSPLVGQAGKPDDGISPLIDYAGIIRPATGFTIGAYEPSARVPIKIPANNIKLTVTNVRTDKFIVNFDSLNYSTRDIDTLGLWIFQNTLPRLSEINTSTPFKSYGYADISKPAFYGSSVVSHVFEPGDTCYFLASVRNRDGVWAPFDTNKIVTVTILQDKTPPPNNIVLSADRINDSTYNALKLSWHGGENPVNTDADTMGIWYRTDGVFPSHAGDAAAILGGMYPFAATNTVTITGLKQKTSYYFSLFVKDTANNWSGAGDSSQARAIMPESADKIPPVNNLVLQLQPDTAKSSRLTNIFVTWDTAALPADDPGLTAEIYYDTLPLNLSLNNNLKSVTVPANSGKATLEGVARIKKYFVYLRLADKAGNESDSISSATVTTLLGSNNHILNLFTVPDTIDLQYEIGTIKVGWNHKQGAGISNTISYINTTVDISTASKGLFPLSYAVHINEPAPNKPDSAAIFLSFPVNTGTITATATANGVTEETLRSQVRLYRYDSGKWYVVYSSGLVGNKINGSVKKQGYYLAVWDKIPPIVSLPDKIGIEKRKAEGIPSKKQIQEIITISETIANARAYTKWCVVGSSSFVYDTITFKDNQAVITIPDSIITERGYRAFVTVTDGVHNTATINFSYPVTFKTLTMPDITGKAFNFISIPGKLTTPNCPSVFNGIIEGKYDPYKMRFFLYEPSSGTYLEASASNNINLKPRQGYWIITKNNKEGINVGAGKTVAPDNNYVHLVPGWNDIGIPFNFNSNSNEGVRLGDILSNSPGMIAGQYRIFSFNTKKQQFVPLFNPADPRLHDVESILKPWQGYTVYSFSSNTIDMLIPPVSKTGVTQSAKKDNSKSTWQIDISAKWADGMDSWNGLGINPEAHGFYAYSPEPVSPVKGIVLHTYHEDSLHGKVAASYEFKDKLDAGKTWPFVLKNTGNKTQKVSVNFTQYGKLPSRYSCKIWIPGITDSSVFDAEKDSLFTVVLRAGDSISFKVLAGLDTYLSEKLTGLNLPGKFALRPNYPNPFNPSTMISFDIPFSIHAIDVSVGIYDCKGKLVTKLYQGGKPGYYRIAWNGTDYKGNVLGSGIYFVRMQANGSNKNLFHYVRKLILIK